MPTKQQRDKGLETVNKREGLALVSNALAVFLASEEFKSAVRAEVAAYATETAAKWGGLVGEGQPDPYAHGFKTVEQLAQERNPLHGAILMDDGKEAA